MIFQKKMPLNFQVASCVEFFEEVSLVTSLVTKLVTSPKSLFLLLFLLLFLCKGNR